MVWEHPLEVHMQTQSLQVRGFGWKAGRRAWGKRVERSVGYSAISQRASGSGTEGALQLAGGGTVYQAEPLYRGNGCWWFCCVLK